MSVHFHHITFYWDLLSVYVCPLPSHHFLLGPPLCLRLSTSITSLFTGTSFLSTPVHFHLITFYWDLDSVYVCPFPSHHSLLGPPFCLRLSTSITSLFTGTSTLSTSVHFHHITFYWDLLSVYVCPLSSHHFLLGPPLCLRLSTSITSLFTGTSFLSTSVHFHHITFYWDLHSVYVCPLPSHHRQFRGRFSLRFACAEYKRIKPVA